MGKAKIVSSSRRNFMKGAALAAGAGVLAGCAPKVAETGSPQSAVDSGTVDWLGTEPEIKDIGDAIETDVVVIGAGTGGAYAAASCLEKGLKVILLEKGTQPSTVRNDWGAIGSKWQIEGGAKGLDKATILRYHQMYCANRIDSRLPRIWADESAEAINWVGDLILSKGGMFDWEGGYEPDFEDQTVYAKFPTGHSAFWPGPDLSTAKMFKEYIEGMGGEYRFETTFVKFEHDGNKVTAAIAKDKDGKYLRFVGKKGIVLSTGGYQGNVDMLKALQPHDVMIMGPGSFGGLSTGDGIKACLWMGAAMDECHTSMIFDRWGLLPNETPETQTKPTMFWLGSQPWLKVNLLGERFMNEAIPYDFAPHAAARQPGRCYVAIMDSTWFDQVVQFATVGCSRIFPYPNGSPNDTPFYAPPGDMEAIKANAPKVWQSYIDSGHLQQADTPEELATKLNIPTDTFAATVKRYNELADKGVDDDFYKEAYRLLPLSKPPYYGIRLCGMMLCTMDGIRIDTHMRPMDSMNVPFEGLHVIGDSSGSFYANTYPNLITGYANGRTCTFARRVARILAGEPVELA